MKQQSSSNIWCMCVFRRACVYVYILDSRQHNINTSTKRLYVYTLIVFQEGAKYHSRTIANTKKKRKAEFISWERGFLC